MNNIIERFMKSPMAQKLSDEEKRERLDKRQEHVKELSRVRVESEKEVVAYLKAVEVEEKKVSDQQAKLESAKWKLMEAEHSLAIFRTNVDRQISQLEHALKESADPAIQDFMNDTGELYETTRHRAATDEVKRTLKAIGQARRKAEAMLLEARDSVKPDLQKLRASFAA